MSFEDVQPIAMQVVEIDAITPHVKNTAVTPLMKKCSYATRKK